MSAVTELPPTELRAGPDRTGSELKRGMFFNAIALLASNFRGVFTFLIARLLGAASLGTFLVAWATTDILSKIGMFGLDNAIVPFIARAEADGDRARSRAFYHLAVGLAVGQSALVAGLVILVIQFTGGWMKLDRQLIGVLSVLLCALPGVNLYRICTAVSRAMKVMKHDIWSRGLTEPTVSTIAFLGTVALGWKTYGAAIAAILGTGASGIVALALASSLFRSAPSTRGVIAYRVEARRLLTYSASISGYDLINALIVRLDVVMLGCFVGQWLAQSQPDLQSDLRPADCRHDSKRRSGSCRRDVRPRRAMDALDFGPAFRRHGTRRSANPQHLRRGIPAGLVLAGYCCPGLRHELLRHPG
jgi:O-antigen/teichoic acid export membrane protein